MNKSIALLALVALAPAAAAPPKAEELVLVTTESRIEVDAAGNITAIKTTPELPAPVLAAVEGNLRKLKFAPPSKDGRAVAGVTYAWQSACAAPHMGSYNFVVKFRGNGPSTLQRRAPIYPRAAERMGIESTWEVRYAIDATGKGRMLEAKRTDGKDRYSREFEQALSFWFDYAKFVPEQLDGLPVETQMTDTVEFVLDGRRKVEADRKTGNDACVAAIAEQDPQNRQMAVDSPFKPIVAAN